MHAAMNSENLCPMLYIASSVCYLLHAFFFNVVFNIDDDNQDNVHVLIKMLLRGIHWPLHAHKNDESTIPPRLCKIRKTHPIFWAKGQLQTQDPTQNEAHIMVKSDSLSPHPKKGPFFLLT